MRSIGRIFAIFLLGLLLAGGAWADRGHARGYSHGHGHTYSHGHYRGDIRFGVAIDPFWPYYYPAPYYYPPVVTVPSPPPVYIERGSTIDEAAPAPAYWYYCDEARAYYPYVKQCPGGWQRVAPQPPPQQ